jgi:aryl sulfotransferase
MKRIFWLASYPRSGNTWFRLFLANLKRGENAAASVNELEPFNAASRFLFDRHVGTPASELTAGEIDRLRPRVYERMAGLAEEPLFIKAHDKFRRTDSGEPIFSPNASAGAVYIVRHPADVALSLAPYLDVEIERAVEILNDPDYRFGDERDRLTIHLPESLGSWSDHARSWLDQTEIPLRMIRYEDALADPVSAFREAARFLGLPADDDSIRRAVERSDFKIAKRQEETGGFIEHRKGVAPFFRKGRSGGWRDELPEPLAREIFDAHAETMRRLGYLEEA